MERSVITGILGNIEDSNVLEAFVDCIGTRWDCEILSDGRSRVAPAYVGRTDAEIVIGAKIARAFTYLATRTYKGRPLVSGMLVVEDWALGEGPAELPPWILRFANPISLPVDSLSGMENLAQLADGENSLLLADTLGELYGVVDVEGQDLEVIPVYYGGYLFVTTHDRTVILFGGASPVCHHDGFEWKTGTPRGKILRVCLLDICEGIRDEEFEPIAWERCRAFVDIVEQLSSLRVSSMIAVCDRLDLDALRERGLIVPLRSELNDVEWFEFETPPPSYLSIFRLDGVHFVSKEFQLMSACQKVLTLEPEASSGIQSGKAIACHLSKLMGESAFVIKVSTDGTIYIFRNGRSMGHDEVPDNL